MRISSLAERRFFFVSCLSLDEDLRLAFAGTEGPLEEVTEGRRGRGGGATSRDGESSSDSGTMRRVEGSTRFDGPAAWVRVDWSCLGRPRAAAAHESRVERLARRAAS